MHSNAPYAPTGYGQQCNILVPWMAEQGHDMAISAFYGLRGAPQKWHAHPDIPIYPAGEHLYGGDVIGAHARHFGADLIITVMDQWAFPGDTLDGIPIACYTPIDCDPLGEHDHNGLVDKKAWPIAFSRFGERVLKEAGFFPLYAPHCIDTEVFCPPADRKALREAMQLDDKFVIFINSANSDKSGRKGWAEQFAAFSRFHARHDDTILLVHANQASQYGFDLPRMAARMGVIDAVKFSAQYLLLAGLIRPESLRGSYGAADLCTQASLAEGFGLPIAEALSCGTPVVVTDGSSMTEVGGPGAWKVKGEKAWADGHGAWWMRPHIDGIVKAYEQAYTKGASYQAKKKAARPHALQYDKKVVLEQYWTPVLAELEKRVERAKR